MSKVVDNAIIASFIKLLGERPLDKITVKDIVEDCGVSRNTFYYHFEDIPSLLEHIMRAETERVLAEYADAASWEEGFLAASEFVQKNKKAVYHSYYSGCREIVERYFNAIAREVMERFINRLSVGTGASEEDKALIGLFYRSALTGLIREWLEGGMTYSSEDAIRRIGALFSGHIEESLRRSGNCDA